MDTSPCILEGRHGCDTNAQLIALVTFARDINSLATRVSDSLLNDRIKKNGFLRRAVGFYFRKRQTIIDQYHLFGVVIQLN